MIPTFLCIGVPRGGTTWLHETLKLHPDVAMSDLRKEIHFFDNHFDNGLAWYQRFFPQGADAERYRAAGDVTPHYLYSDCAPTNILATSPGMKLLLLLRDPVKRTFSHYTWRIQMDNYGGTFDDFLRDYPNAISWSRYADHLPRYLGAFPRDQLRIMFNERMFADVPAALREVCEFIGVDAARLPVGAGEDRVNTTIVPRFGRMYRGGMRFAIWMNNRGFDKLTHFAAHRLGLRRLLMTADKAKSKDKPRLSREQHIELYEQHFADSIESLETMLSVKLDEWKPKAAGSTAHA